MPHSAALRNYRSTVAPPRRPYEKERIDSELKLCGQFGLKNKKEIWRLRLLLSKIRSTSRELLTLNDKDDRRNFEGAAILRRLHRYGILDETKNKLDYALSLTVEDFLDRRLQTRVYKQGLARSIHHARVLIRQRHIRVRNQVVNVPSFLVRLDSQKHIDFALSSPFGGGRAGRNKRKKEKTAKAGSGGGEAAAEGGDE